MPSGCPRSDGYSALPGSAGTRTCVTRVAPRVESRETGLTVAQESITRLPGPPLGGRGIFRGMDPELVVAEHFAQLVNLAVHQRPDEELQESLNALLEALESLPDSGVDLSTDGQLLRANRVIE